MFFNSVLHRIKIFLIRFYTELKFILIRFYFGFLLFNSVLIRFYFGFD